MRCVCGYGREHHEAAGHCPLCACGKLPGEHVDGVCPGKPLTAAGHPPRLRRGSFREQPGPAPTAEWFGLQVPIIEAPVVDDHAPPPPPLVPARLTVSLDEIAPRAVKLGETAAGAGWFVVPWYWHEADRTDASVLVMRRGELRAVAYWRRAPGVAWKTAGGQAWRIGDWPRRASITAIAKIVADPEV